MSAVRRERALVDASPRWARLEEGGDNMVGSAKAVGTTGAPRAASRQPGGESAAPALIFGLGSAGLTLAAPGAPVVLPTLGLGTGLNAAGLALGGVGLGAPLGALGAALAASGAASETARVGAPAASGPPSEHFSEATRPAREAGRAPARTVEEARDPDDVGEGRASADPRPHPAPSVASHQDAGGDAAATAPGVSAAALSATFSQPLGVVVAGAGWSLPDLSLTPSFSLFDLDPGLLIDSPLQAARLSLQAVIEQRLGAYAAARHEIGLDLDAPGAALADASAAFAAPLSTQSLASAQKEFLAMALGSIGLISIYDDLVPEDGAPLSAQVYGGSAAAGGAAATNADIVTTTLQSVSADVISAQGQFSAVAEGATEAVSGGGAEGADIVIVAKYDETIARGDGTTEEYSGTVVHAVNYPGFDFAGGPLIATDVFGGGFEFAGLARALTPGLQLTRFGDLDDPASNALASFNNTAYTEPSFGGFVDQDAFVTTESTENTAVSIGASTVEVF